MPRRLYEPILPKSREWPVVRLSKNRNEFIKAVAETSYQQLLATCKDKAGIRAELETTMYREVLRIKRTPWKVDAPDEREFWEYVKGQLVDSATSPDDVAEKGLLMLPAGLGPRARVRADSPRARGLLHRGHVE